MCKNIVEPGRPYATTCRMRFARGIPNATNTHSEYVVLIAFLEQERLHKSASMLRYQYIANLVISKKYCVLSGATRGRYHTLSPVSIKFAALALQIFLL
jgi:hypothetical protein